MNKNLIAFFTHRGETYFPDGYRIVEKGNAEKLAEIVSKIIPADIFEIKTEKVYPVSYRECCDEAKAEHQKRLCGTPYKCPIPAGVKPRAIDKL